MAYLLDLHAPCCGLDTCVPHGVSGEHPDLCKAGPGMCVIKPLFKAIIIPWCAGVGIASMGVMRPELVMKSIVPVVMAGVLGIYGLIIAVIISTGVVAPGGERTDHA